MKTRLDLTPQERYDIVSYRIDNAQKTMAEVETHIQNQFYNTAANRMYYACYYAVCALLIANKYNAKSHDGVRQLFSLHFIKTGILPKHLSVIYSTLFKQRLSGDYDDMFDNTPDTVAELYPKAQEFIAAVKEKVDEWLSENKA